MLQPVSEMDLTGIMCQESIVLIIEMEGNINQVCKTRAVDLSSTFRDTLGLLLASLTNAHFTQSLTLVDVLQADSQFCHILSIFI